LKCLIFYIYENQNVMNSGQYVFAQVALLLPHRIFDRCVNTFQGNKGVRHFTCWHQLMCMMFGQLSNRESLRDLVVCVNAHKPKHYHLGLGKHISRSTLAEANERRDYRIYETYAYELIAQAQHLAVKDHELESITDGNVYALDSTIIDLCLNSFWWATFRKTKAAVKVHTLLDLKTAIPTFVQVTAASVHDLNELDNIKLETGGFYVMDRGYIDFKRLDKIDRHDAFFVVRSREKLRFKTIASRPVVKSSGVLCDELIELANFYPKSFYSNQIRRVKFYDEQQDITFIFLTNNKELAASDIALLYKYRWRIELLFKWIKQHLKIKTFWGRSINAVKTQIYIAVITYVLIILLKSKLKLTQSIYEIIQIIGLSLVDKTPLKGLFEHTENQDVKEQNSIQLKINLI